MTEEVKVWKADNESRLLYVQRYKKKESLYGEARLRRLNNRGSNFLLNMQCLINILIKYAMFDYDRRSKSLEGG